MSDDFQLQNALKISEIHNEVFQLLGKLDALPTELRQCKSYSSSRYYFEGLVLQILKLQDQSQRVKQRTNDSASS